MSGYKKKLIEVALPLDAINIASEYELKPGIGAHPRGIHYWWARRPLAACKAVLFAQLVDDPSAHPEKFPTEEAQELERERLFDIIRELVKWENVDNEELFKQAQEEILRSTTNNPPSLYDPFAGGGSIPMEAQRLGLDAYGSDLNPVAVMIGKSLIEIPPKFSSLPPINPEYQGKPQEERQVLDTSWKGAKGLAEDVLYYGQKLVWEKACKKIGHLYPEVELPNGEKTKVIAWIWARTVASPNPLLNGGAGNLRAGDHLGPTYVPLVSTFMLSTKAGREAWVEPVIEGNNYRFEVRFGPPPSDKASLTKSGTKLARGANFRCLISDVPITPDYIKAEGIAGRMGTKLLAVVVEKRGGKTYISPTPEMERLAKSEQPSWKPEQQLPDDPRNFWTVAYGLTTYGDLFNERQLVALNTFSDLIIEIREQIYQDAVNASIGEKVKGWQITEWGDPAKAYADAIALYLSFAVDRLADFNCALSTWKPSGEQQMHLFTRAAIPMAWDFVEANILGDKAICWKKAVQYVYESLLKAPANRNGHIIDGDTFQRAAQDSLTINQHSPLVVSTDPPYYDNIVYADLSDFFYVWLRRTLKDIYPREFSTLFTPKDSELVATPYRHGGRENAEKFFMDGMSQAFKNLQEQHSDEFPMTIYYAFKQSETREGSTSSTGWETFLEAIIRSGFSIHGTWPLRTEQSSRMIARGTNALASSIVLVCRKLPKDAPVISRGDFIKMLRKELPFALQSLQHSNIAPVDMAQASIGPGMAIFSRHSKVLESDGTPMTVRTGLHLINEALDDYLAEQEGEYDADTRFAITWFEQFGMNPGKYGDAETLANARNVSVQGVVEAGILESKAGFVRLLKRDELDPAWDPDTDKRCPIWESTQHLIRSHEQSAAIAGRLLKKLGDKAEIAKALTYRLYSICERKKWTDEALAYNNLVQDWPAIVQYAQQAEEFKSNKKAKEEQLTLL